MLEYVLDAVWTVADEIYVVFSREPSLKLVESIASFGVKIVIDKDSSGTVSNMITGFKASRSDHSLVVSENTPFIKPSVIFALFEAAHGYDAAIPKWKQGKIEPLPAVYSRKPLLKLTSRKKAFNSPEKLIDDLYAVRFVEIEKDLKELDPELNSFFNVRTSKDLRQARALAAMTQKP